MGDWLLPGKPSQCINDHYVNSAFYLCGVSNQMPIWMTGVTAWRAYLRQVLGNTVWYRLASDNES